MTMRNNGNQFQNNNRGGFGGGNNRRDFNRDGGPNATNGQEGGGRFFRRPRVPEFVIEQLDSLDYKQVDHLRWFVNENGRIKPRRQTGLTAHHQRLVAIAIKRARHMALLGFVTTAQE
jgi:small subunit ribosomal protein S18